jgi:hypothetical protein
MQYKTFDTSCHSNITLVNLLMTIYLTITPSRNTRNAGNDYKEYLIALRF